MTLSVILEKKLDPTVGYHLQLSVYPDRPCGHIFRVQIGYKQYAFWLDSVAIIYKVQIMFVYVIYLIKTGQVALSVHVQKFSFYA